MASIYRAGQCTGTGTPPVSYRKKYRLYRPLTGCIGEIRLFRPVNGYRAETRFYHFLGSQSQGIGFQNKANTQKNTETKKSKDL